MKRRSCSKGLSVGREICTRPAEVERALRMFRVACTSQSLGVATSMVIFPNARTTGCSSDGYSSDRARPNLRIQRSTNVVDGGSDTAALAICAPSNAVLTEQTDANPETVAARRIAAAVSTTSPWASSLMPTS